MHDFDSKSRFMGAVIELGHELWSLLGQLFWGHGALLAGPGLLEGSGCQLLTHKCISRSP